MPRPSIFDMKFADVYPLLVQKAERKGRIISQNQVALMTLDDRYLPTAIALPFEGHARQSV